MNVPKIGEILKSRLTGKEYELRKITGPMAVLYSLDGLSQILTGKENLHLFYEMVINGEPSKLE